MSNALDYFHFPDDPKFTSLDYKQFILFYFILFSKRFCNGNIQVLNDIAIKNHAQECCRNTDIEYYLLNCVILLAFYKFLAFFQ